MLANFQNCQSLQAILSWVWIILPNFLTELGKISCLISFPQPSLWSSMVWTNKFFRTREKGGSERRCYITSPILSFSEDLIGRQNVKKIWGLQSWSIPLFVSVGYFLSLPCSHYIATVASAALVFSLLSSVASVGPLVWVSEKTKIFCFGFGVLFAW